MDKQRPTFPLPPEAIRNEKIRAFLTSKQVWIPFLVLVAAGIYGDTPVWALVPLLGLAFFVLALVWQAHSGRLLGKITERIVAKSNRTQDASLVARIRALSEGGEDGYAVTLGKFLEAKQAIEAGLHPGGKPTTPGGEDIEKRVDAISFGVADSFDAVLELEKQIRALEPGRREDLRLLRARQKEHLTRIIDAYKVVKSALSELDLLARSPRPESSNGDATLPEGNELDAEVAGLREEIRIAVEGRLRATRDIP